MFQPQLWPQLTIGPWEKWVMVANLHSPVPPPFPPNLSTACGLGSAPSLSSMSSFSVPPVPSCHFFQPWVCSLLPYTLLWVRAGFRTLTLPTHPHSHTPFTCLVPKACISISWLHSSPPVLEGQPGGALQGLSLTCRRRTSMGTLFPRTGHSGRPSPSGL